MGKTNTEGTYFDKNESAWKPMVGSKWGRLKIIAYLGRKRHGSHGHVGFYKCQCDCGTVVERNHSCLTQKQTVSCGCWKAENVSKRFRKINTAFEDLWHQYRRGAKDRGFCWELTKDQFKNLTQGICYYTGRMPRNLTLSSSSRKRMKRGLEPLPGGVYIYNGIDRLDNEIGYIEGNCVSCCEEANRAKHKMSSSEFINLCSEVSCFRKKEI